MSTNCSHRTQNQMRLGGTCALAALFRANNSVSQSRPGLTSSRGSTLIFEQRTLATLESFFVLHSCSALLCLSAVVDYSRISSAKQSTWQAKPSRAHVACSLAWLRCGASVCVWRINFRSGFCQISKKNFRIV